MGSPLGSALKRVQQGSSANWVPAFVLFSITCQLALLVGALAPARVLFRVVAFTASLGLFFLIRGSRPSHPASKIAVVTLMIVALSFFHPTTNNAVSGFASFIFYLAILAPLFWVPRIKMHVDSLRRTLLVFWIFHSLSAAVGALQVFYPGEFQPTMNAGFSEDYTASLQIMLASGETVFRPMGLSDTPGGAGLSGYYAFLLSVGFLFDKPKWWFRLLLGASLFVAMFALYLCQVRSMIVMLAICVLGMGALLSFQGRLGRFALIAAGIAGVVAVAFTVAVQVGGVAVTDRLATLGEGEVYYNNRGFFLAQTLEDYVPLYPLGAGLGRWGMISQYFADPGLLDRGPIYAEIQWTGWLFDGGLPLCASYFISICAATVYAFYVAIRRVARDVEGLWLWGALIVGYNLGAIASTFNAPFFNTALGMEFWLLNAALFAASRKEEVGAPTPVGRVLKGALSVDSKRILTVAHRG